MFVHFVDVSKEESGDKEPSKQILPKIDDGDTRARVPDDGDNEMSHGDDDSDGRLGSRFVM